MASDMQWHIKDRDWRREVDNLPRQLVQSHPFSTNMSSASFTTVGPALASALTSLCEVDPLSAGATSVSINHSPLVNSDAADHALNLHTPPSNSLKMAPSQHHLQHQLWSDLLGQLNSSCATDPHSLVAACLAPPESIQTGEVLVQNLQTPIGPDVKTGLTGKQRIAWRMQQLELREAGRQQGGGSSSQAPAACGFTPHQFTEWVSAVKANLRQAWSADQRSLALKLAIQCVRLLSVSSPYEFYGNKFALIVDVLDTLAGLVLDRLASCGDGVETGRNWWRKVCSIRELLPRLYLQTALLPAAFMFTIRERDAAVWGVCGGVRGVGDGVVGAFLRSYISRCLHSAHPLASSDWIAGAVTASAEWQPPVAASDWLLSNLEEAFRALNWTWSNCDRISSPTTASDGGLSGPCSAALLLQPVLLFLCGTVAQLPAGLSEGVCERLVQLATVNGAQSVVSIGRATVEYVWLRALLRALLPSLVTLHARDLLRHTAARQEQGVWCSEWCREVLAALAAALSSLPSVPVAPGPLLADALPLLHPLPLAADYLPAAAAWIAFAARHCSEYDAECSLRPVLRRVTGTEAVPQQPFLTLLTALLQYASPSLCCTDSFLGLVAVAHQSCRDAGQLSQVVTLMLQRHTTSIDYAPLAQQIVVLAAAIHSSHSLLTTEDERRHLSVQVCGIVQRLQLTDVEQQLRLLVSVRAAFPQLQPVLVALVHAALRLLLRRHPPTSKWAGGLSRSCVANAFISIASLVCPAQRLRLYLLTACAARLRSCHGQADACLKSSIRELSTCLTALPSPPCPTGDCWAHASPASLVGSVAGALVAAPDPPTAAPLYLLRGLVQAVSTAPQTRDTAAASLAALGQALCVVGGVSQSPPPYTSAGVEPELLLCSADTDHLRLEADQLCSQLLNRIVATCSSVKAGDEASFGAAQVLTAVWAWLEAPPSTRDIALAPLWKLLQRHSKQAQLTPWLKSRLFSSPALLTS